MKTLKLTLLLTLIVGLQIAVSAQIETVEGFFIEGEINGKKVSYIQKNTDSYIPSNRYFPKYKMTHLQAYEAYSEQALKISLFNLKLDEIRIPLRMTTTLPANFSLSTEVLGYDMKGKRCSPLDEECAFTGSSKSGTIQAFITKLDYKSRIIEGEFSGKLILLRIGSDVKRNYPDTFIVVKNGKFKIKFRIGDA